MFPSIAYYLSIIESWGWRGKISFNPHSSGWVSSTIKLHKHQALLKHFVISLNRDISEPGGAILSGYIRLAWESKLCSSFQLWDLESQLPPPPALLPSHNESNNNDPHTHWARATYQSLCWVLYLDWVIEASQKPYELGVMLFPFYIRKLRSRT